MFEKSYLVTLVLFLLLLNACIFALGAYTYRRSQSAALEICRSEMACIQEAFERDAAVGGKDAAVLLPLSYVTFYEEDGIYLQFADENGGVQGELPVEGEVPAPGDFKVVEGESGKHVLITEVFGDGDYTVTYVKDIGYVDLELKRLSIAFGGVSLLASLVLALALYPVQRRLFSPLEKLRDATNALAEGQFDVFADERGKDEVAQMAKDFNKMSKKLHRQMEELKAVAKERQTMLDNLGHEMRTPLTSIYGYAEHVFRNNPAEEKRLQAMVDIMAEAKRLKRISEVLLDAAFLRENGIEKGAVSAAAMAERICSVYRPMGEAKGITVTCKSEDFTLEGDETLLEVLLSNLTENALRACEKGGTVVISASMQGEKKMLAVLDDGRGMTEEQLSRITEPFYRTDKGRSRKEGGTGLGLALCKRIADAHGAELVFTSSPGKGTLAEVRFP